MKMISFFNAPTSPVVTSPRWIPALKPGQTPNRSIKFCSRDLMLSPSAKQHRTQFSAFRPILRFPGHHDLVPDVVVCLAQVINDRIEHCVVVRVFIRGLAGILTQNGADSRTGLRSHLNSTVTNQKTVGLKQDGLSDISNLTPLQLSKEYKHSY